MDLKRICICVTLVCCALSLMSCARVVGLVSGKKPKESAKPSLEGLKAYENAGGRVTKSFDDIAAGNVATRGVPLSTVGITPQEDIVWAPEDPDEEIAGGLESLWKQPDNVAWHTNYKQAIQLGRESGKPIMIWFTNSARSPTCKILSRELFSGADFSNWAAEKIIRLRLDEAGGASSTSEGSRERDHDWTEKKNYHERLKKKYKALGSPTVLILSPSGSSVAKYRGYKKGDRDYYWGRMKSAVSQAEADYGVWREKLESRGYRLWSNRQGRKIFAKLNRFKKGKVTLIDPDGKRGSTSLSKLSDADQAWILQEKEKYDKTRGR